MISELTRWESYYVIVGSSAAALTGLQFVVITLIADSSRLPASMGTVSAFGTPTVVHFCSVLLVAAIVSAPWTSIGSVAWAITAVGLAGILYGVIVLRRAHGQTEYRPVLSDWIWHTVLPLIGYTALLIAGIFLGRDSAGTLFLVGAASLLLLFIGIHNAWDTVTYIAVARRTPEGGSGENDSFPDRTPE
jgi:hypothetical protein